MSMAKWLCDRRSVVAAWQVRGAVRTPRIRPPAAEDKNQLIQKLVEKIESLSQEVSSLRRRMDPEFYSDADPQQRLAAYEQHVKMKESSLFKDLKWQFLGPTNISGRVTDVAVPLPRGKNYTLYVAAASGGVWKTTNEGTTWKPVFEHAASTSIGDVTVAPSDANIVWVGTGEANIFRSSMAGAGVYKSTDAGETWTHMGLAGTHTIPRIVIHPDESGHRCSWPRRDTSGRTTRTAASTRRSTAARPGSKCCTSTSRRASSIW